LCRHARPHERNENERDRESLSHQGV
jgi:hypothetical protein